MSLSAKMKYLYRTHINPDAGRILNLAADKLPEFLRSVLDRYQSLSRGVGRMLKDAPESAVVILELPGYPKVCVKELRWRGWAHALKAIFRPTQGLRSFRNGLRLQDMGFGAAAPLALIRKTVAGLPTTEWVIMEVIPDALEFDRYILQREATSWTTEERRGFVRTFGRCIGSLHSHGIFHSDLKTCNILVDARIATQSRTSEKAPDRPVRFTLVDYDDVMVGKAVSDKRKLKNLVQIFLSTPIVIRATDRLRFLSEYSLHAGIDRKGRRELARNVLKEARGRDILYVGFDGDVTEKWD